MLPPHFHPGATNIAVAVEGETEAIVLQKNGATFVRTVLSLGKLTLLPPGSIHLVQNNGEYATIPLPSIAQQH
jgi:oxalate decarboxylase/phosphoglucose isomerase-like protein (cupin superfamily)